MAGTPQTIQRNFLKLTNVSQANFYPDANRAFFDQINNLVTDAEALRKMDLVAALQSSGLAIHGAASPVAKAATAFYYVATFVNGSSVVTPVFGKVAANTDTAAFSGTVTNTKFNVFVHSFSDDGTNTRTMQTRMGTEGANLAAVVFPVIPANEVVFGITVINPTGTGNFVGGTTALDDGTVVPNAAFISVVSSPTLGAMSLASGLVTSSLVDEDIT